MHTQLPFWLGTSIGKLSLKNRCTVAGGRQLCAKLWNRSSGGSERIVTHIISTPFVSCSTFSLLGACTAVIGDGVSLFCICQEVSGSTDSGNKVETSSYVVQLPAPPHVRSCTFRKLLWSSPTHLHSLWRSAIFWLPILMVCSLSSGKEAKFQLQVLKVGCHASKWVQYQA